MALLLPPELIEKILIKCDGKTLLSAKNVASHWNDIISYLTKKTSIWKWCCIEEIPPNELVEYLDNYKNDISTSSNNKSTKMWYYIYKNWVSWQDLNNIQYEIALCPAEVPRITCIDVAGNYIAVGSEDGRVRIFDHFWQLIYMFRHQADKVSKVTFFSDGLSQKIDDMCFVVAYSTVLIIDDIYGNGHNHVRVEDVKSHSIYKNFICYQKVGGRLTIEKLQITNHSKILTELWFARIYSPANITAINMWHNVCLVLVDNDIKIIHYNSANTLPMTGLKRRCLLNFSLQSTMPSSVVVYHMLRDDTIIILYKAADDNSFDNSNEYMEVIILDSANNYVTKLFNSWDALQASITCVFLFGNTLVLGVDSGIIYFYHVSSWKHFDIRDYQKKIIIGKHPIINMQVNVRDNCRKFYVTSSFNIHEVTGFASCS